MYAVVKGERVALGICDSGSGHRLVRYWLLSSRVKSICLEKVARVGMSTVIRWFLFSRLDPHASLVINR